ncbi:MAG: twitching motility protein PilT [Lachnospiraceae bacterium]|uniref:Twitching motility protein PilT n=1 Tax=Hominiventricola filiformis TaxID=2885352 RepID=A0AAE3DBX2_9FIRM|nr:twitching motility protein PilT [Hominiventricola filiformis]MCI6880742.1 twitching motility protein PilT [Clostridiaceae bacterium]MDY3826914.1 twitching motility protein PilT [Lachnospiraceae bacterium]QUO21567.1 twitching motility protein PilT [Clostridiaceae bacterium Marseille-Q4143]RHU84438.1 twitching motility protein PilT [Clostridiaceae bacterium OM08-6BH]MCC2126096.1 twitching motility protein PilT [Hominiventricola filiformis]
MVQLIVGVKGAGKTKKMLDHVHDSIKNVDGNIVYLDKSSQNMHELDNKVRLINVSEYPIQNTDQFLGFVCGICSQDYDLQEIYLDGFLKISGLEGKDISDALKQLNKISEQFKVNMILSVSMNEEDLPEFARSQVI